MNKYHLVVFSNPIENKEDEYNEWYSKTHLHDVLKIRGFVAAQRFKLSDEQLPGDPSSYRYMAIYKIETDDLEATLKELVQAQEKGNMVVSSALDIENVASWIFTPITEQIISG
jgi:hypothetical protein